MFLDRAMSKRGSFFSKQNYNSLLQTKCQWDFFSEVLGRSRAQQNNPKIHLKEY